MASIAQLTSSGQTNLATLTSRKRPREQNIVPSDVAIGMSTVLPSQTIAAAVSSSTITTASTTNSNYKDLKQQLSPQAGTPASNLQQTSSYLASSASCSTGMITHRPSLLQPVSKYSLENSHNGINDDFDAVNGGDFLNHQVNIFFYWIHVLNKI